MSDDSGDAGSTKTQFTIQSRCFYGRITTIMCDCYLAATSCALGRHCANHSAYLMSLVLTTLQPAIITPILQLNTSRLRESK